MRVLHVVPSYVPAWRYGGPIRSVHGLCKALVRAGHDVHVFTTDMDGRGRLDVPTGQAVDVDGVKVWYFAARHLKRLFWAPEMKRALRLQVRHFQLLHLHSIYLWPTAAAAAVARTTGIPYVLAPRGMLVKDLIDRKSAWLKKSWIHLIERRNLAAASAIHFTSLLEQEEAEKLGLSFRYTFVVPNGVDSDELATGCDLGAHDQRCTEDNSGLLVYIGRLSWKKGLDRLIAALALLPGCRLIIAGNDEERYQPKLETLAAECGVSARVTFPGAVYGAAKAALLRKAAAFVLPSHSENFGNVVIEAMAAGCPVVVTPEVGAADLVQKAGAGVVVDGRPDQLAAGIRQLLADSIARHEMGNRGRRMVASHYTWDVIASQIGEIYAEIVSHGDESVAGTSSSC